MPDWLTQSETGPDGVGLHTRWTHTMGDRHGISTPLLNLGDVDLVFRSGAVLDILDGAVWQPAAGGQRDSRGSQTPVLSTQRVTAFAATADRNHGLEWRSPPAPPPETSGM